MRERSTAEGRVPANKPADSPWTLNAFGPLVHDLSRHGRCLARAGDRRQNDQPRQTGRARRRVLERGPAGPLARFDGRRRQDQHDEVHRRQRLPVARHRGRVRRGRRDRQRARRVRVGRPGRRRDDVPQRRRVVQRARRRLRRGRRRGQDHQHLQRLRTRRDRLVLQHPLRGRDADGARARRARGRLGRQRRS